MSIVLALIVNLFVVYMRIWIIDTIFGSQSKIKLKLTIKVFLIWFFLVFGLFFYKYFLDLIWKGDLYFLQDQTLKTVSIFLFFCDWIFIILAILFRNIIKKNSIHTFLIINLLFFGIYFAWYGLGISMSVMYYIISSYAEEYLKYWAWNDVFLWENEKKQDWNLYRYGESDLIFFCMLIALWFSVVENIFYVWFSLYNWEKVSIISTLVSRWLVSTLIHVVSTGLIALIYLKLKPRINVFISIVLWLMAGIAIHSLYNISLHFKLWYLVVMFVVIWYFIITYLIYNSDVVYKK